MAEGGGEDKMAESRKEKEKINDSLKDSEKQNSTSSRKKEKEEEEKESTMSSLERGINKLSINNPTTDHQSLDCPTLQQQLDIPHDCKCPICYDKRLHSITLPSCGHSFCYLCIKGVYARQKVCPLCRQSIPSNSINCPLPLNQEEEEDERKRRGTFNWYYQAKSGGWWLYDERVSLELERYYLLPNATQVNIQISGFVYTVDFIAMIQYRQEKPDRVRRIKRTIVSIDSDNDERDAVRGVAGIPHTSDDN